MIGQIFGFVLKLVLGLFAAIFAVSLLVAALILMVLGRIKALLTGQKPQPMVFGRFQRFSPQGMWPGAAREAAAQNGKAGDVVDVEAREIRDNKRLN